MYSPSRKVRASVRRTLWLIIIGFLGGFALLEIVLEFGGNSRENQFAPTRSAGLMLNRSQMLLAKEILLEPTLFTCIRRENLTSSSSSVIYPLYIIVKTRAVSSGEYFQRRMFTRTSWGREAHALGIPVIYAVGRAKDNYIQKMVENEHKHYEDLLQFNYIDAYYNISIKSTGILNWFVKRDCQHVTPYLFIVDDDVLINLQVLLEMLSKKTFNYNTLYGLYLTDIEPHPSGRWAVSLDDYPNRTFPSFITGASTLYPSLIVNKFVEKIFYSIEQNRSIFFLDDVLITGIIAEQLGIQRAAMFGIEDCSYTDLFTRVIISECSNVRRVYVWSKFILSRIGENTFEIDRLIRKKTSYIKWRADFKSMRNGTAIISGDNTFERSILIILSGYHPEISFVVLFVMLTMQVVRLFGRMPVTATAVQRTSCLRLFAGIASGGSALTIVWKQYRVHAASSPPRIDTNKMQSIVREVELKKVLPEKFDWNLFWYYLRPQIWIIACATATALVVAYLNVAIPLELGHLINAVSSLFTSSSSSIDFKQVLTKPTLKLIELYIYQSLATFEYITLLSIAGERMAASIRRDLFQNVLKLDMEFFDRTKTGEIMDRLTSDVQEFKSSFKLLISQGMRASTQIIGSAISLYCISPALATLAGVVIPTIIAGGTLFGSLLRQFSRQAQAQLSKSTGIAYEAISNIRTTRAFGAEENEHEMFQTEVNKARDLNIRLGFGIGIFQGLNNLVMNGIILGTIALGGQYVSQNRLTAGDLMAFLVATQTIQRSLTQISVLIGQAIRGLSAGARIHEYQKLTSDIPLQQGIKIPFHSILGQVQFSNVSFAYPTRDQQMVLENFHFTIPSGKTVAIVGPSGSGKSTLCSLLVRFYDPLNGEIRIDGKDIRTLNATWLRSNVIGMINQEPTLFSTTIMENIRFGKTNASDREVIEAAKLAMADDFIQLFPDGYQTIVGERGVTVSGGQRQRIAIARALLKNPSILILDEATSALDAESEKQVQSAINNVAKGRTTLIIAHRLSTIRNADIIGVMLHGKLVEMGTHNELIAKKNGVYAELMRIQQSGINIL